MLVGGAVAGLLAVGAWAYLVFCRGLGAWLGPDVLCRVEFLSMFGGWVFVLHFDGARCAL